MIFTYWEGNPLDIALFTKSWSRSGVSPSIYSDDHVIPVLQHLDPCYAEIYTKIRIPACKSDVARIALLYRYGGIYMDAHAAPKNEAAFQKIAYYSNPWELIIFDDPLKHSYAGDVHIVASSLIAKRDSSVLGFLLHNMLQNLLKHRLAEESAQSYVPYNIFALVGAWEIRIRLFNFETPYVIIPEFKSRVFRYVLDHDLEQRPVQLYVNYGYRKSGQHWSERQNVERLFA